VVLFSEAPVDVVDDSPNEEGEAIDGGDITEILLFNKNDLLVVGTNAKIINKLISQDPANSFVEVVIEKAYSCSSLFPSPPFSSFRFYVLKELVRV
jgi:hypothetical protein